MTDVAFRLNRVEQWHWQLPPVRLAARLRLSRYPKHRLHNRRAAMRWLDMYVEHRR